MKRSGTEAEELGAEGGGGGRIHALFHGISGGRAVGSGSCVAFVISFVINFLLLFRDRPGRRATGELATCRHCADSGREKRTKCTPP